MTKMVNIYDAKTRFSKLVDRAASGEEVIIARAGRPVARLVAWRSRATERKPGRMRGHVRIARSFDAPLPAELFDDGDES